MSVSSSHDMCGRWSWASMFASCFVTRQHQAGQQNVGHDEYPHSTSEKSEARADIQQVIPSPHTSWITVSRWLWQRSPHKWRLLWQRQRSIHKRQSCKTQAQHLHWQKFKWFVVAVKYKMKFMWLTHLLHESQGIRLKIMSGFERTFKFFLKCLY